MIFKKLHAYFILFSGLIAISSHYFGFETIYSFLKPITTILIILFAFIHGHRSEKKILQLTIIGLLFCLLGDTLLLKDSLFIYGLGAFLIAHILFIISFVKVDGFKNYFKPFIILLAIGITFYAFTYPFLKGSAIPVLIYVVVILVMAWQGIGLYIWKKKKPFFYIMIGALLFVLSDTVIAVNKFVYSFELSKWIILTLYWMAIFFIAKSATMRKKML